MSDFLLINGPNLNLLGGREPGVYGTDTLESIETRVSEAAERHGYSVDALQSNAEHALVERIHAARSDGTRFILINPGAFTHTSIALRDALLGVDIPFIEIHLSNTFRREAFRHTSYFSDIAVGCVIGFGAMGYELAVEAAHRHLTAH